MVTDFQSLKMDILKKELYLSKSTITDSTKSDSEYISFLKEKHPIEINRDRGIALLITDMQKFFLTEKSHAFIPSAKFIVPRINMIRSRCEELKIPVIFTRHINSEEDAGQMGKWWRDILTRDNLFSEIIDEFPIGDSIVIEKSQYDSFYKTDLDKILKKNNISQLIVSGVMTHLCCETTAREAFVRGYDVFFGIDFTATYNRIFHNSTLINLSHGFSVPVFAEELLDMLK